MNQTNTPYTANTNRHVSSELIDFDSLSTDQKRDLTVHLLEQAISAVERQGRELTEWEADTLSGALGASLAGMYKLAMTKIELSQLKRNASVHPQTWLSNTESYTCAQIRAILCLLRRPTSNHCA